MTKKNKCVLIFLHTFLCYLQLSLAEFKCSETSKNWIMGLTYHLSAWNNHHPELTDTRRLMLSKMQYFALLLLLFPLQNRWCLDILPIILRSTVHYKKQYVMKASKCGREGRAASNDVPAPSSTQKVKTLNCEHSLNERKVSNEGNNSMSSSKNKLRRDNNLYRVLLYRTYPETQLLMQPASLEVFFYFELAFNTEIYLPP